MEHEWSLTRFLIEQMRNFQRLRLSAQKDAKQNDECLKETCLYTADSAECKPPLARSDYFNFV